MEEKLKELMQELGNAINESLSDSDRIAAAIGEIKRKTPAEGSAASSQNANSNRVSLRLKLSGSSAR